MKKLVMFHSAGALLALSAAEVAAGRPMRSPDGHPPAAKPAAAKPSPEKAAAEKKAPKAREPQTYTAPHDVYVDGVYHKAGRPFTTAHPKGKAWDKVTATERAAAAAADPAPGGDTNLEALDADQLLTLAAAKDIDVGPVRDKEGLIAIIKAEHQPNG